MPLFPHSLPHPSLFSYWLPTPLLALSPRLPLFLLPPSCPASYHILTALSFKAGNNSNTTRYLQQSTTVSYCAYPPALFTSHHVQFLLPCYYSFPCMPADPEMQQWKWRGNIRLSATTRKHVLSRSVSVQLNSITISPICLHWMFAIAFPMWNRNRAGGIYFVWSAFSHAPDSFCI